LITLPDYFHNGVTLWETYQLQGKDKWFNGDIERFNDQEEAEVKIKNLMCEDIEPEIIVEDSFRGVNTK